MANEVFFVRRYKSFSFYKKFFKLCDSSNKNKEKINITAVCEMYNEDYIVKQKCYGGVAVK